MARSMRSLSCLRFPPELESAHEYQKATGRCLFCDLLGQELDDGRRLVASNPHFAAVVPFYARYPYEVHVTSKGHRLSLLGFGSDEKRSLAEILKARDLRLR